MDINKVDRIVISSNSRMEIIIKWFQDNEFLLKDREWKTPINKGCVELKEESLGFAFNSRGSVATLTLYARQVDKPSLPYLPIVSFDYNVKTGIRTNYMYHTPKEKINAMKMILEMDKTPHKACLKYCSIMAYMAYNREYKVSNHKTVHHKATTPKITNKRYNNLQTKVYVLDGESGCVGHHNSPSYEFEVRGYYRHYKSGKVIWFDGFTKCKGKGKPQNKHYQI